MGGDLVTAWNDRTLEQQTAYIRKTYASAPTPDDVRYASAQFDAWLDAITTSIHKTTDRSEQ